MCVYVCVCVCVFVEVGVWVCMVCVYLCVWYMYDVCTYTLVNSWLCTWLVLVLYNTVCRYTSVNLCFSLCVYQYVCVSVYAILACVRWFLYRIWDVCICVYMT